MAITDGSILSIEGNTNNRGKILNEGAMRLSGDWTNNGEYSSVSGTFSLSGDNQIFTPGSSSYSKIIVDSRGVELSDDLIISSSLELVSGIISLEEDATIFMETDSEIISGGENSYINGALFLSGSGNLTFPIGTASQYLPVTLALVQAQEPVGIKAYDKQLFIPESADLEAFSNLRYWLIFENSSFSAEEISLPVIEETFIKSSNTATIAFSEDLQESLQSIGMSSLSGSLMSGTISAVGSIRSGYYVIGEMITSNPPITVINLVTSLQDGKHDFLRIENIEFYENNLVEIFDRQGVKVFEMNGYDNQDRVFKGNANVGSRGILETGSYYYAIRLSGNNRKTGFVYVKN